MAWTPFCIPKLGGHTHAQQNVVDFPAGLHPAPPPLDSLVFTNHLDHSSEPTTGIRTAQNPLRGSESFRSQLRTHYGDQNSIIRPHSSEPTTGIRIREPPCNVRVTAHLLQSLKRCSSGGSPAKLEPVPVTSLVTSFRRRQKDVILT